MRHFHTKRRVAGLLVVLAAGCAGNAASPPGPPPAPPPPEVVVAPPVVKEVADYEDTTGRIGAIKTVEVRARVTGYLQKINFTEGTEVKAGDVLFEIDPRPYEAELARAEATVGQSQARLRRLTADLQRAIALRPTNAIGREEYDKIAGDRNEAEAGVKVATAARDLAALNVEYTKVKAPIDGLVGRHFIDVGNLVKADETALTTIVTQDPMYAWFDVDERTLLRLRRMQSAGQLPASPAAARMKVLVGLADEEGFPHEGTIDFVDNQLDSATGTLHLRAVVPNPRRVLTPGLFVRIRVPMGLPKPVLMVPEEALGTDQGRKFVYVVGDDNKAAYRPVKVGKLHDGLRVIAEGLKEGERVVVDGLQRVRPGAVVAPKASGQRPVASGQ